MKKRNTLILLSLSLLVILMFSMNSVLGQEVIDTDENGNPIFADTKVSEEETKEDATIYKVEKENIKELLLGFGCEYDIEDDTVICKDVDINRGYWAQKIILIINGIDLQDINDTQKGEIVQISVFIRLFLILMLILIIYSILNTAEFPPAPKKKDGKEGFSIVRLLLSIFTGILAMLFIPIGQLMTAMQTYSALGITITVFFPILILGYLTVIMIKNANPMGLFMQKIIWIIYSVYLFLNSIKLKGAFRIINRGFKDCTEEGKCTTFFGLARFASQDAVNAIKASSSEIISNILLITSIAIFFIMVVGNKRIIDWIDRGIRFGEAEARKSKLERSKEFVDENADQMKNS